MQKLSCHLAKISALAWLVVVGYVAGAMLIDLHPPIILAAAAWIALLSLLGAFGLWLLTQ